MPLLLLAYLGFVSVGLPDGMLGVAWPHMRGEFGVPVEAVGLVLFVGTAGYALSGVSAGLLIGRLGVGRLLAISTGLAATALLGFATSPGLVVVVAVAGLLGLGSGAIDAGLNAYAARHFGARHMNWLHASYSFGATLGPLVVTAALALGLAWRGGYAGVAGGQLLLATAFVLTAKAWRDGTPPGPPAPIPVEPPPAVPQQPVPPAEVPLVEAPPEVPPVESRSVEVRSVEVRSVESPPIGSPPGQGPAAGAGAATSRPRVARTLALRGTWLGAAAFAIYVAIELAAGLWAYTLLTEQRGVGEQLAGVAVAAYWASLFVGRLLVGFVADRIGVHRVLTGSVLGVIVGGGLVSLPAPALVTVVGLMGVGLACAPVFPLLMLTTAERVGSAHADRVIGIQIGASAVGGTLLPAGIGVLIGALGAAVLGPALVALGATLTAIYLVAHPSRRRHRP